MAAGNEHNRKAYKTIERIYLSLAYLAEKEKTETLPTVTEETESDTIAFETTDSKVKIKYRKD